jgi:hypothetical protein
LLSDSRFFFLKTHGAFVVVKVLILHIVVFYWQN